jgi:hypothetical protein
MISRCQANSPLEKLRRAALMPAAIIFSSIPGDSQAGPMEHTIFVSWRDSGAGVINLVSGYLPALRKSPRGTGEAMSVYSGFGGAGSGGTGTGFSCFTPLSLSILDVFPTSAIVSSV